MIRSCTILLLTTIVRNCYGQALERIQKCPAGTYRSLSAENGSCTSCPAGKIASDGLCFMNTELESKLESNIDGSLKIRHHSSVRSYGGSCYAFISLPAYWTNAERYCHDVLGGHLACVRGQNEAKYLSNTARSEFRISNFWIGLNERGNARAFDWSNPRCCSEFRNWFTSNAGDGAREPNEDADTSTSRCVKMIATGASLFDENCRTKYASICEANVYSGATHCTNCRKGSYASDHGATRCNICPLGKYTYFDGATKCENCPLFSPARVLAEWFGTPHSSRVDKGQSVRCGGQLGPRQRRAYLAICILTVIVPFALSFWILLAQGRIAQFLVRRGFAVYPTTSRQARRIIVTYTFPGVQVFGIAAGTMFAIFLEPMHQRLESWPFKGRRTPTNLQFGCDPVGTKNALAIGIIFLILLAIFLIAATPVINLRRLYRSISDIITRYRLRRRLEADRRKTQAELKSYDQVLQGNEPISGYSCALCTNRADALNIPCGHQIFCLSCAQDFRNDCGQEICNFCRRSSKLVDVRLRHYSQQAESSKNQCLYSSCRPKLITNKNDQLNLAGSSDEVKTTNSRTANRLRDAIIETRRVRDGARFRFLASTCGQCTRAIPLVIHLPCGHATVCADCAASTRDQTGDDVNNETPFICPRCAAPCTGLAKPILEVSCSVCYDIVPARHLVALGKCGHTLCSSCSVYFIRSALNNVSEQITADGLSCPLGGPQASAQEDLCQGIVSHRVVERLVNREVRPEMQGEVLPLSPEEFDRLQRFMYEAKIPVEQRFFCCHTDCARLFAVEELEDLRQGTGSKSRFSSSQLELLLDAPPGRYRFLGVSTGLHREESAVASTLQEEKDENDHEDSPLDVVVLEQSDDDFTNDEDSPYLPTSLRDNEESKESTASVSSTSPDAQAPFVTCPFCSRSSCIRCKSPSHTLLTCEENQQGEATSLATTALIQAMSRPCPKCKFAISHPHSHSCHHIRPGSGCPNCGTHFCYACLRAHGISGRRCSCRLFCESSNIIEHLIRLPYPHDSRCKCPICPDCEDGAPCSQCPGSCVVCLGRVPPGPKRAEDVDSWYPELERDQEEARKLV